LMAASANDGGLMLMSACYQAVTRTGTIQAHLTHLGSIFFVASCGLRLLRLDSWNFVNRRSLLRFQSPVPDCEATGAESIISTSELRGFEGMCPVSTD
jgi:hypothetical protein